MPRTTPNLSIAQHDRHSARIMRNLRLRTYASIKPYSRTLIQQTAQDPHLSATAHDIKLLVDAHTRDTASCAAIRLRMRQHDARVPKERAAVWDADVDGKIVRSLAWMQHHLLVKMAALKEMVDERGCGGEGGWDLGRVDSAVGDDGDDGEGEVQGGGDGGVVEEEDEEEDTYDMDDEQEESESESESESEIEIDEITNEQPRLATPDHSSEESEDEED